MSVPTAHPGHVAEHSRSTDQPEGRPHPTHPAWCDLDDHTDPPLDEHADVCLRDYERIALSRPQPAGAVGGWLQVRLLQAGDGPSVHLQAGELAAHGRVLTLDEAEQAAAALTRAVAQARGDAAPVPAPAGVWPAELAVEWGVWHPAGAGTGPAVEVYRGLGDAQGALDRLWGSVRGAHLVWRAVAVGPWAAADGPHTQRNTAVTLSRCLSGETNTAPSPCGEDAS